MRFSTTKVVLAVALFSSVVPTMAQSISAQANAQKPGQTKPTWNATAQFSDVGNPNGVWTYGFTDSSLTLSTFMPYSTTWKDGGRTFWSTGNSGDPQISFNGPVDYTCCEGHVQIPANTLSAHPGYQNNYSVIRFKAPNSGKYSINASFWGDDNTPTSTDVHVITDTTRLFTSNINAFGPGSTQTYSNTVELTEGSNLYFAVGIGNNGHYFWDSTGLQAVVTRIGDIPTRGGKGGK
jgi:hypothetical protein